MKKIIAIVLSAVMLVSLMTLTAFAEDYSIMELEEYGQQRWVIEGKTEIPPIADGVIEEGEYTLAVEDMDPFNDSSDNRFFCIDGSFLDVENFNLYFSYDDDYIYVGAKIKESEILDGEQIKFLFSCNPKDMFDGPVIRYKFGSAPESAEAEAFNTAVDGDVVTYEIVMRRTLLIDYMGYDDVDDIKEFALQIVLSDDRDPENNPGAWPEMWFGCISYDVCASSKEAAAEEGKLWGGGVHGSRFPHVIVFGEARETKPVETEPTETTPTETTPVETAPVETTPTETTLETDFADFSILGCGGSIAAIAIALVSALGTCVAFVNKRK